MRMTFMDHKFLSTRLVYLYVFLFCVSLLLIAAYMEHVMGLEPCPLCITQRVFFLLTGLVALAACLHNPQGRGGRMAYGFGCALLALGGSGFAMRQIYLQNLPPELVPACGPSLGYMLEVFPLSEVLTTLLTGDGNCAEISWRDPVIGMTIPQWTLLAFLGLAALCIYQALRKPAQH